MEPTATLEHLPFVWGIAFSIDIIIGVLTFMLVVRKNVPDWTKGVMTWIGWWSWASALSLIVNAVEGATATFSYHQIGVFTETMTNIGVVAWALVYAFRNWYVRDTDWYEMDRLRADITSRNQIKDIGHDAK